MLTPAVLLLASAGNVACGTDPGRWPLEAVRAEQSDLSLRLNLPAFRLDLLADGHIRERFAVSIGSLEFETPLGQYEITTMELNPSWVPPESEWASGRLPMAPGPDNPMGRAKLRFRPLYYIHGTPELESLGQAISHGCVRMANRDVVTLTRILSAAHADLDASEIERRTAADAGTSVITLSKPVSFTIVYRIAEVSGDTLLVHPDVYRRELGQVRARVSDALVEAGVPRACLDSLALDEVLRGMTPTTTVRASLRSLIVTARAGCAR